MYKINSASDSRGDEQVYMQEFQNLLPRIMQYKQEHGGDLEGAFQAVTGKPWPAGRSVKLHNGMPEMTKDRTVKSVLGKYVAPIGAAAAAAFVPGLAPALMHSLGIGGGSSLPAGAGMTAAQGVEGAATTGLAGSGLAGSAGGLGAATVTAGGAALPTFGPLASGLVPAGAGAAPTALAANAGPTSMLGKAGSYMKELMGGKEGLGDLGKALGSFAETEAGNRETTGDFTQAHDRLMMEAQREQRANEQYLMNQVGQTQAIKDRQAYSPAKVTSGQLPSFGFGQKASSDAEKQAAGTLQEQVMRRLPPGGSYSPAPLEGYTKPGLGEKVGNWGSLVTSGLGFFGGKK